MLPTAGLNVKLTDAFINHFPSYGPLRNVELEIINLKINKIIGAGRADYDVYFTDPNNTLRHITTNQDGKCINSGVDVFESYVYVAPQVGISIDYDEEENCNEYDQGGQPVDYQKQNQSSGQNEPKNNDGRTTCFWCGNPTKQVGGLFGTYDVCSVCGR